jgi:hypothetical protein
VLHQVGSGIGVAQVAQPVSPRARGEQPVQLGFSIAGFPRRGGGDTARGACLRRLGKRQVDRIAANFFRLPL